MATVATIPQTTVAAGARTFGPASINSAVSQFLITITQVSWPHAGDQAFSYVCDVSLDGGVTWLNPAPSSGTVADAIVPARNGSTLNTFKIGCDIPGAGNANRRIRLTTVFSKSLTISGTIAAN